MQLDPQAAELLMMPEKKEEPPAPPSSMPVQEDAVPDDAAALLDVPAQPVPSNNKGTVVMDEWTKATVADLLKPKQEQVAKYPQATPYDVARVATESGIGLPNEPGPREQPTLLPGRKDQVSYVRQSVYGGADVAGLKDAPLGGAYLLRKYANENGLEVLFTSGARQNGGDSYHDFAEAVDVRIMKRGKSGQLYAMSPEEEVQWGVKLGKKAGWASMLNEIGFDPGGHKTGDHLHFAWGVERNLKGDPSHHLLNERYPEDANYLKMNPSAKLAPAGDKNRSRIPAMAEVIAKAEGLDPDIFVRMVQAESNFDPAAVSSVGATGLVQMMPDTVKEVAAQLGVSPEEYYASPHMQLKFGAQYLKTQLKANGGNYARALAAYNAGPGALDEFKKGKEIYAETRNYVKNILGDVPDSGIASEQDAIAAIVNGTGRTLDPDHEKKAVQHLSNGVKSESEGFLSRLWEYGENALSKIPGMQGAALASEASRKGSLEAVIEDPSSRYRKQIADVSDFAGLGMGLDHFLPWFQEKLETRESQKAEVADHNLFDQVFGENGAVQRNIPSLIGMYVGGGVIHKALKGLPIFSAAGKGTASALDTLASKSANPMITNLRAMTAGGAGSQTAKFTADLLESSAVGATMMGVSGAVDWLTTEGNDPISDPAGLAKAVVAHSAIGGGLGIFLGTSLPMLGATLLNTAGNLAGKSPMANNLIGAISEFYQGASTMQRASMRTIAGAGLGGALGAASDMLGITSTVFGEDSGNLGLTAGTGIGGAAGLGVVPVLSKVMNWSGLSKKLADSPMGKAAAEYAGKVVDNLNTAQLRAMTKDILDSTDQAMDLSYRDRTFRMANGADLMLTKSLESLKGNITESAKKATIALSEKQKLDTEFQTMVQQMEAGEKSMPQAVDFLNSKQQLEAEFAELQKQGAQLAEQVKKGQAPGAAPIPGLSPETQQSLGGAATQAQQMSAAQVSGTLIQAKIAEVQNRIEGMNDILKKDKDLNAQVMRLTNNRNAMTQRKAAYEAKSLELTKLAEDSKAVLEGFQDTEKTLSNLQSKFQDIMKKAQSPEDFRADFGDVIELPKVSETVDSTLLDPVKMREAHKDVLADFVNQVMHKSVFQGSTPVPAELINDLSGQYMTMRAKGGKLRENAKTVFGDLKERVSSLKKELNVKSSDSGALIKAYRDSLSTEKVKGVFSADKKLLEKKAQTLPFDKSKVHQGGKWMAIDSTVLYKDWYNKAIDHEMGQLEWHQHNTARAIERGIDVGDLDPTTPIPEPQPVTREQAIVSLNKRISDSAKTWREQLMWGDYTPLENGKADLIEKLGYAQAHMDLGESHLILNVGEDMNRKVLSQEVTKMYKQQKMQELKDLLSEIEATEKLVSGPLANPIIPDLKKASDTGKPYSTAVSGPYAMGAEPREMLNPEKTVQYLSKRIQQLEEVVKGQPFTDAEKYQLYLKNGGNLSMSPAAVQEFVKNGGDLSKASPEVRAFIDYNTLHHIEEIKRVRWLDRNVIGQAAGGSERIVSASRELRAAGIPELSDPTVQPIIKFVEETLSQIDSAKIMDYNQFVSDMIRSDSFHMRDLQGIASKGWQDLIEGRNRAVHVVMEEMIVPAFNNEFSRFKEALGKEMTPVEEAAFFREMADSVEDLGEMKAFKEKYKDKAEGLIKLHYGVQSVFEMIRANSPELYDWARANYWPHRWKKLAEHNSLAKALGKVGISAEMASEHAREHPTLKYADTQREEFRNMLKKKRITEEELLGEFDDDRAKLLEYGREPAQQAQWDRLTVKEKEKLRKVADKKAMLLLADDPVLDPRELYRMQFSSVWRADAVRRLLRTWNNTHVPAILKDGSSKMYRLMEIGEGKGNYQVGEMVNGKVGKLRPYHNLGEMESFKNVKFRHPDYAEPVNAKDIWIHPELWGYLNNFVGGDTRPYTGAMGTLARGWELGMNVVRNSVLIGPFFSHMHQMISGSMGEFWRTPMRAANLMGAGKAIRVRGLEGSASLAEAVRSGLNVKIMEHGTQAIAHSLVQDYGLDTANKIYGVENLGFLKFLQAMDPTDPMNKEARKQLGTVGGFVADTVGTLTKADYVMNREMLFKPIEQGQLAGFWFRTMEYLREHQAELMELPPERRMAVAQQWAADMTNRYMGTLPGALVNNPIRQVINKSVMTPSWWMSKAYTIADGIDSAVFIAAHKASGGRIKRSLAQAIGREAFSMYPPEVRMAARTRMATGIAAGLIGSFASVIAAQYIIDRTMPWEGSPPDKWLHVRFGGNYYTGPVQGFTRDLFKDILHIYGNYADGKGVMENVFDTLGRAVSRTLAPPVKGVAAILGANLPGMTQRDGGFSERALGYLDEYSSQLSSAPELAGLDSNATFSDLAAKVFYPFLSEDRKREISAKTLTSEQYLARIGGFFDTKDEGEFMRARGEIHDRKRAIEAEDVRRLSPYLNKIRLYYNSGDTAKMTDAMKSLMNAYSQGTPVTDRALKALYPNGYRMSQQKLSSLIRRAINPDSAAFQGAGPETVLGMVNLTGELDDDE